jgi:hypothetical protein
MGVSPYSQNHASLGNVLVDCVIQDNAAGKNNDLFKARGIV